MPTIYEITEDRLKELEKRVKALEHLHNIFDQDLAAERVKNQIESTQRKMEYEKQWFEHQQRLK